MSRAESEETVRRLAESGDTRAAADTTIRTYGPEIFGFLAGVMDDPDAAGDVFSAFSERVWKGIAGFRWQCSLRTWSYTIARNELARHRSDTAQKRAQVGLSTAGSLQAPSRQPTPLHQRSSFLDAFAQLRSSLGPDDRDLLVLRVDRGLAWNELALLFLGQDATPADVAREAARLRKRFQVVKEQLTRAATASGLLPT
ncbi:MAG TPA: sigma-70 family RNA polymerase sigma factor [Polyangiaceae bacterium]|jgi:RNA polymerase sigma-70 factor (ECF subfamily)